MQVRHSFLVVGGSMSSNYVLELVLCYLFKENCTRVFQALTHTMCKKHPQEYYKKDSNDVSANSVKGKYSFAFSSVGIKWMIMSYIISISSINTNFQLWYSGFCLILVDQDWKLHNTMGSSPNCLTMSVSLFLFSERLFSQPPDISVFHTNSWGYNTGSPWVCLVTV